MGVGWGLEKRPQCYNMRQVRGTFDRKTRQRKAMPRRLSEHAAGLETDVQTQSNDVNVSRVWQLYFFPGERASVRRPRHPKVRRVLVVVVVLACRKRVCSQGWGFPEMTKEKTVFKPPFGYGSDSV